MVAGTPRLDEFRKVFGDEREDYKQALQTYYQQGPATDWRESFVSALRIRPSLGRLGGNVGSLSPHGGHVRYGFELRPRS